MFVLPGLGLLTGAVALPTVAKRILNFRTPQMDLMMLSRPGGARVVAFARNPDKLAIAKEYGVDHVINVKGKSAGDVSKELSKAAGQGDLDAIIDCAGAPEMMQLAFSLLGISGHYVDVGLVGDRVDIPLFPRVSREQTFHGSYWGNNIDLTEVMALAAADKIRHTIKRTAPNIQAASPRRSESR